MIELTPTQRLLAMSGYTALVLAIIFAQLLPLRPGPGDFPGPDVMLLLTIAWMLRRPAATPIGLIAGLFLLADFLFMRPPGLWALIVVIMTERIRGRHSGFRDMPFAAEWLAVSIFITLATLAHVGLQLIFIIDRPGFGQTVIRLLATLLCYPIVVAFGARAFGLRKPATGEFNPLGVRS